MPGNKFPFSGFSSAAVHAGHQPDPNYAHLVPIYASSTYVFDEAEQGMRRFSGEEEGYIYSRWGNPTITEAEKRIAALESFGLVDATGNPLALKAILHASGMAAISTLFISHLKAGDKVLSHYSLYGGTDELLEKILPPLGIEVIIADLRNLEKAREIIQSDRSIKMLYLETPANPTIQCVDLEELTRLAKEKNLLVAVDNTFATPYLQQPFRFGVDLVIHSTTKFLNGHGTAIGGVLIGSDLDHMNGNVTKVHRLLGGNSNPFDAFLLSQGIKTLEVRMQRHCHNAMEVAGFLENHPAVSRVNYLGLSSHPDYHTASKQMSHAGAMLSFEMKDGLEAAKKFINNLQMCIRAVSLGTCDTLLCHPASMTHHGVAKEHRERYGITDGLIRMSVGIENIQDILMDLDQALSN
ncbi:MAG TPA: PLP-dependent aspartate aminotransferase family protein [Ferruginibacter sp.]|nr:cystathionine gamma-synthase [Chitinophagaceae bacterium]HRI25052.1 PLP-dependent aspartate aminotransferase family protein [Ferruginibacter sp.]